MMSDILLPNCITSKTSKGEVYRNGVWWVKCYCGNCHKAGPYVVKQDIAPGQPGEPTFAFYLCDSCYEKHGVEAGKLAIPDQVFWKEVEAAQMEMFGRILLPPEIAEILKDENSTLSKLARDRYTKRYSGE